ncbi:MAG: hypothetical protein VB141_01845 [Burkholderia gladioli]
MDRRDGGRVGRLVRAQDHGIGRIRRDGRFQRGGRLDEVRSAHGCSVGTKGAATGKASTSRHHPQVDQQTIAQGGAAPETFGLEAVMAEQRERGGVVGMQVDLEPAQAEPAIGEVQHRLDQRAADFVTGQRVMHRQVEKPT